MTYFIQVYFNKTKESKNINYASAINYLDANVLHDILGVGSKWAIAISEKA